MVSSSRSLAPPIEPVPSFIEVPRSFHLVGPLAAMPDGEGVTLPTDMISSVSALSETGIVPALNRPVMTARAGLAQVFNRFVLNKSLSWSEEFQIFCHIWIVFLAIAIAYRRGAHLSVESLSSMLPPGARRVFDFVVELLWIWFACALAWLSWRVSEVAKLQYTPGLEIPMSYPYYGMVIGGAYLLLVVLRRLLRYAP